MSGDLVNVVTYRVINGAMWAHVDDFGAVADGVTDCADAFQGAIDASGDPLVSGIWLAGSYRLGHAVTLVPRSELAHEVEDD